jgi:hypothetical protein
MRDTGRGDLIAIITFPFKRWINFFFITYLVSRSCGVVLFILLRGFCYTQHYHEGVWTEKGRVFHQPIKKLRGSH